MASEQFSLCWDNFHKNMSSGMNSLLENEDLVDVTLAVQGKCLKAHKMVLSVCSPYFKELFKSNPCQHPIVFMKDVSYEALSDLLQFMYQGEVQVSQENLTTFIKTAEALQIKGLTGDGNGSSENDTEVTQDKPVHHQVEEYKPPPRPKKQPPPSPIVTSPQIKRSRLSNTTMSSNESQHQPIVVPPPITTKTEPVTPVSNVIEPAPPVQFKMEPYDQTHSLIDETGDETFGDDTLDDNTVDDTEDYSMMEGGVGEEEPQAGTSTDGAGEGQAGTATGTSNSRITTPGKEEKETEKTIAKGPEVDLRVTVRGGFVKKRNSIIFDGYSYAVTYKRADKTYYMCSARRSSNCKARAVLEPGEDPKVINEHTHPPDYMLEKKSEIWNLIKQFAITLPGKPLQVYSSVVSIYPETEDLFPYKTIEDSIRGFRKRHQMKMMTELITTSIIKRIRRKPYMPRYIVDGFVFHVNITKGNPRMLYLRCLEYKRLGCHARAVIPYDGTIQDIKVNKPHNHPPDMAAEEKIIFMRELKEVTMKNIEVPPRKVYETLANLYPNAARETHFEAIRHKMNRWRRQLD